MGVTSVLNRYYWLRTHYTSTWALTTPIIESSTIFTSRMLHWRSWTIEAGTFTTRAFTTWTFYSRSLAARSLTTWTFNLLMYYQIDFQLTYQVKPYCLLFAVVRLIFLLITSWRFFLLASSLASSSSPIEILYSLFSFYGNYKWLWKAPFFLKSPMKLG